MSNLIYLTFRFRKMRYILYDGIVLLRPAVHPAALLNNILKGLILKRCI